MWVTGDPRQCGIRWLKWIRGREGPTSEGAQWRVRGVQWRVEARVSAGSVGAEVTRTGSPAPHTQCLLPWLLCHSPQSRDLAVTAPEGGLQKKACAGVCGRRASKCIPEDDGDRQTWRGPGSRVPACRAPPIPHSNPASTAPSCRSRPGCTWSSAGGVGRGTPEFTGDNGHLSQEEAGACVQKDRWGSSPRWGVRTQVEG